VAGECSREDLEIRSEAGMKTRIVIAVAVLIGVMAAQTKPAPKPETKEAPKPARQRVNTNASAFELAPQEKVQKAAGVAGASRGGGESTSPVLLAPHMGKLYGPSPRLAWNFGRRVRKFVVVVTDENQEEIYRADVTRPEFQYPQDAPRLEPGKTYYWHVEPEPKAMDMGPSAPAGMKVLSDGELKELEQALSKIGPGDSFEAGLARAQLFRDHGLWYDALGAYGELIEKNPNRSELYEQRAEIYAQLEPTKELAERDAARAKQK
jgi:Domain of Unknown Function (DUF928)